VLKPHLAVLKPNRLHSPHEMTENMMASTPGYLQRSAAASTFRSWVFKMNVRRYEPAERRGRGERGANAAAVHTHHRHCAHGRAVHVFAVFQSTSNGGQRTSNRTTRVNRRSVLPYNCTTWRFDRLFLKNWLPLFEVPWKTVKVACFQSVFSACSYIMMKCCHLSDFAGTFKLRHCSTVLEAVGIAAPATMDGRGASLVRFSAQRITRPLFGSCYSIHCLMMAQVELNSRPVSRRGPLVDGVVQQPIHGRGLPYTCPVFGLT